MVSYVIFIVIVYLLGLLHTFGHLIFAKLFGVHVTEFGTGLPPKIVKTKLGSTYFSFNLIPIISYVKLKRFEELNGSGFLNKSRVIQLLITLSGIFTSLFIAVIAFFLLSYNAPFIRESGQVKIQQVMPGSPAALSGLEEGDIVKNVNNIEINSNEDFINLTNVNLDNELVVRYIDSQTNQENLTTLVPRKNPPPGEGATGVVITSRDYYSPSFLEKIRLSIKETHIYIFSYYRNTISNLISFGNSGSSTATTLPIGIYALTSITAQTPLYLIILEYIGNNSLKIFGYLLPLPFLAGGNILIIFLESLTGMEIYKREKDEIVMI